MSEISKQEEKAKHIPNSAIKQFAEINKKYSSESLLVTASFITSVVAFSTLQYSLSVNKTDYAIPLFLVGFCAACLTGNVWYTKVKPLERNLYSLQKRYPEIIRAELRNDTEESEQEL